MKDNTLITIGFSISVIMLLGMFWVMLISDAWKNTPTNYTININMDNETKEAIAKVSEMDLYNYKCIVKEYKHGLVYNQEDSTYNNEKILVREYLSENCSVVG